MSPPPTDAERVATKEKGAKDREVKADEAETDEAKTDEAKTDEAKTDEAKADEAKAYEAMYAEETVKRALAQGEEYVLNKYPQFEGIPVLDEPYAYAMWKIYERDGSN
ncbi:hypothetical protein CDV31_002025 [Fusarium ambrosium]|uniref:Uncharacterized protein n=1 Tax=Fusarium ambrosium TaxID=131363 RepID=A0A428UXU5_9HYPO|nr:hypothetical protein CDV31_002025 [Fusarium ambrosium]